MGGGGSKKIGQDKTRVDKLVKMIMQFSFTSRRCLMLCLVPWFAMNLVFIVNDPCLSLDNDDEYHVHFKPRYHTQH